MVWRHPPTPARTRSNAGTAVVALATAGVAHALPSTLVLGQWAAFEAAPGSACRWRVPGDGSSMPSVALTFDDGPSPEGTPQVLDELDALGLRATFFLLGRQVTAHPDLVGEIASRGHEIGLHGYDHDRLLLTGPAGATRHIRLGLEALWALDIHPRWYRPPYGQLTTASLLAARRAGLEIALWSAWGREWAARSEHDVVDRIGRRLSPGAIVLLHDTDVSCPPGSAARTLRALGPLRDLLVDRGLRPAPLGTLVPAHEEPAA